MLDGAPTLKVNLNALVNFFDFRGLRAPTGDQERCLGSSLPARGQKRSLRSAKGQETSPRPFGHRPCVNSFRWTLRATWVTACVAAAALGLLLGPGARASESLTRSTKGDTNAASIMGAAFCVGPVCVSPRAPLASRIALGAEGGVGVRGLRHGLDERG